jgi:ParB family chromosome partitioning protein
MTRTDPPQAKNLPLDAVYANPDQPRKHFDPAKLAELAASIVENGLLQPITVTPRGERYMVVAGERRLRACILAGMHDVPALVQELGDAQVARLALIENVQREDMNAIETAHGYQALIDQGASHEEVALLLGKRPQEIRFYCQLTQLADNVQEAVRLGVIGARVGWDLARLEDTNDQRTIFAKVAHGELTAAQVSSFVSAWIEAKNQTTIFGEPEHPQVTERRRREARKLGDLVSDCLRSWVRLADHVDDAPDLAELASYDDLQDLKALAREFGRLHNRIATTQRNRALVIETKGITA